MEIQKITNQGMEPKYYVDIDGKYLGSFSGVEIYTSEGELAGTITPTIPAGAIEVPLAPNNAKDIWDGSNWVSE